jgi:hypothetical protein
VPMVGLEPTLPCEKLILSQSRLPIPPHRHKRCCYKLFLALTGFEPAKSSKLTAKLTIPVKWFKSIPFLITAGEPACSNNVTGH